MSVKIKGEIEQQARQVDERRPEEIDEQIVREIEYATKIDSDVWTCPEANRREYAHSFFQYPAMMVPAVQKRLIDIIANADPSCKNMIDPFMGSATTLVASMANGLNCYGQDLNPLASLIAKVRTGPFFVNALKQKKKILISLIEADKSKKLEAKFNGRKKWFKNKTSIEISRIVRAIRQEKNLAIRRLYWVVLAETIRVSSNDRTSTFKLHVRTSEDIGKRNFSAIDVFALHLDRTAEDYEAHANLLKGELRLSNGNYNGYVEVLLKDSKTGVYSPTGDEFYDLMVTSPPYGDNKTTVTYGQHSYLPLQWIDLKDISPEVTEDYLQTTSEIDSRSLGGSLAKIQSDKVIELCELSETLKDTRNAIIAVGPEKIKKVDSFILDLNQTIDNIFAVMKKNSYQLWTVGDRSVGGVVVPNAQIIRELIEGKGAVLVKKVEREILRKRMASRNSISALMSTEDILIFRKL